MKGFIRTLSVFVDVLAIISPESDMKRMVPMMYPLTDNVKKYIINMGDVKCQEMPWKSAKTEILHVVLRESNRLERQENP